MKNVVDKRVNYLIVFLVCFVLVFGFLVFGGLPTSHAVDAGAPGDSSGGAGTSGDTGSSGTIVAETITTTITENPKCTDFTIRPEGGFDSIGIESNNLEYFRLYKYVAEADCAGDYSQYVAYCLDPARSGPDTSSELYTDAEKKDYIWERDLKPDDSTPRGIYDTKLVYMYQNAYPNKDYSGTGADSLNNFYVTNVAMRFAHFNATFNVGISDSSTASQKGNFNGYFYTSKIIVDDCTSAECAPNAMRNKSGYTTYTKARDLFLAARGATTADLWNGEVTLSETLEGEATQLNADLSVTKDVKGTIGGLAAFDNPDPNKSKVTADITCTGGGFTCQLVDESGNVINRSRVLNNGSVDEINYTLKISGNLSSLTSSKVQVQLRVEYFDTRHVNNAFIVYNRSHSDTFQRMVLFASNTVRPITQSFEVSICDMDISAFADVEAVVEFYNNNCDGTGGPGDPGDPENVCLETPALDPDSPEFDINAFKESGCCTDPSIADTDIYELYCAENCLYSMFPLTCDDSRATVEARIIEGWDKNTSQVNYDVCVLDKSASDTSTAVKNDLAGNSFAIPGEGDVNVKDNKYCAVACIEDWKFTLPNQKYEVKAGSYFSITTKITGTRTCVSTDIKYGSQDGQYVEGYFLYDLDKINKEIVDAYNTLNILEGIKAAIEEGGSCNYEPGVSRFNFDNDGDGECDFNCDTDGDDEADLNIDDNKDCVCELNCDTDGDGDPDTLLDEDGDGEPDDEDEEVCTNEVEPDDADIEVYVYKSHADSSSINPGEGEVESTPTTATLKNNDYFEMEDTYGSCDEDDSYSWEEDDNYLILEEKIEETRETRDNLLAERVKIIEQIIDCSAWDNKFDFDPVLSYAYEENYYMNMIGSGNNYFVANVKREEMVTNEIAPMYCQDSYADDFYVCASSVEAPQTEEKVIVNCTDGGCENETVVVPKNQSIKLVETRESLFMPYTVFYTAHSAGEMSRAEQMNFWDTELVEGVETTMGRIFPINLQTPKGEYTYKFAFNQIGQYNDVEYTPVPDNLKNNVQGIAGNDNLGRLMNYINGESDTSGIAPTLEVNGDFVNTEKQSVFGELEYNQYYMCTYKVIEDVCKCCGDEEFVVEGGDPGGGSATGMGVTSEGYFTYYYRTASLNDLFPNSSADGTLTGSREIGANWQTDKGQQVYNAIEEAGENAYREPEYSFTLDPNAMAQIRGYNAEQEASGGFADQSVYCNEYGYDCTSSFLDQVNSLVGYDAMTIRNETFEHYNEEALKYDEGKMPTGVGPSLK